MEYRSFPVRLIGALSLTLWCAGGTVHAATTDIANAPMASSSSSVVKPNVMFILDDSGSMAREYLPDEAGDFVDQYKKDKKGNYYFVQTYGNRSNHCNGVYYNSKTTYLPPVDATGTSYPNASFTGAWNNGFRTGDGTTDLTGRYYYTYSGTEPDHNFTYKNGSVDKNATFYDECASDVSDTNASGAKVFTKVTVSSTSGPGSTDERTNFANWYSYYRTRMLTMKTEAGRAFAGISDAYRVGYSTIGYTGTDSSSNDFLKIADFGTTQKASWYSKLYSANPSHWTPLRGALSKAGRIYAGKLLTGADDPVQYSCQQNFTILSTDGYWNTNEETSAYGPFQIDGSTKVGDQDGTATKAMLDANKQPDTLADVAMYYYQTDLRNNALSNCTGALGSDVCEDNVPGAGFDVNTKQHMTTFTLGMGANGTLTYRSDYLSATSGDYNDISQGTKKWPWVTADTATAIDDLWHAAVNGRGMYFSAQNPEALATGISSALAGVSARTGSSAAAATSNLEPVAGDNYVYIALYRTVKWDGDLQAKTIDPATGALSTTPLWSAQPQLDSKVSQTSDTRTIFTFDSAATNKLKSFAWANLNATEQGYFSAMCSPTAKLSQCPDLTAAQQTATSGANLVNFIRGQNGFEDRSVNTDKLYRAREHVLGDMISSQPVYVKTPPFAYADTNYDTFRDTTQKNRSAMVYVAVNDGMLHAFNGDTGVEQWAYIPPVVMPNLYSLADKNYAANHRYYVDGSPTVGDICPNAPSSTCSGNQWKTILVGGFNAGGRGYYALDITDPANPKGLWNFTVASDENVGLSYGNPVITKRKDGTWVVVITSGYNNVSPGDGTGYLYVLNANTGAMLEKIGTGAGSTATPSGLAKINAWIDSTSDNTVQRFYGGDLQGNVWRFDIDNVVPPSGKEAFLLAQVGQMGIGTQPITTKPELAEITAGGASHAVVYVGTGRYLGISDLTDTSQQSIYAIKDDLTATGLGKVRQPGVLVQQTLSTFTGSNGKMMRTTTTNSVDWATQAGWYVDLNPNNESPGERVNVDMQQQLGLLTVAANVPNANACTLGGYAWLYYFDYKTGQFVQRSSEHAVGERLGTNALVAGIKTIQLTTGKTETLVTDTGGGINGQDDPSSNPNSGGGAKRVSWRELTDSN